MPDEDLVVEPEELLFDPAMYCRLQAATLRLTNTEEVEKGFWIRPRRQLTPHILLGAAHGFIPPRDSVTVALFLAPIQWDADVAAAAAGGQHKLLIQSLVVDGLSPRPGVPRDLAWLAALFRANRAACGVDLVMAAHSKIPLRLPPPHFACFDSDSELSTVPFHRALPPLSFT